jgi:hypothetical protein
VAELRLVAKAAAEPERARSQKHSGGQGRGCAPSGPPVGSSGGHRLLLRVQAAVWREWCSSSIGEEIGGLRLVPAWTTRATAAECLLPVTSQAIRNHLRDRGVGAGVAPEFIAKRYSEPVGIRDGAPTTPSVPSLAMSRYPAIRRVTPASMLVRCSVVRLRTSRVWTFDVAAHPQPDR